MKCNELEQKTTLESATVERNEGSNVNIFFNLYNILNYSIQDIMTGRVKAGVSVSPGLGCIGRGGKV